MTLACPIFHDEQCRNIKPYGHKSVFGINHANRQAIDHNSNRLSDGTNQTYTLTFFLRLSKHRAETE